MQQYNLIYPRSKNMIMYNDDNPKNIAMKIFKNLVKTKNYDNIRIILENNNTKEKIYYIGTTKKKLDEYEKIFDQNYPNQEGGSMQVEPPPNMQMPPNTQIPPPNIQTQPTNVQMPMQNTLSNQSRQQSLQQIKDKQFLTNLNNATDNIAFSASEIGNLIKEKYKPEDNTSQKLLFLVETGIKKLDIIEKNVTNMSQIVTNVHNELKTPDSPKKSKPKCAIM